MINLQTIPMDRASLYKLLENNNTHDKPQDILNIYNLVDDDDKKNLDNIIFSKFGYMSDTIRTIAKNPTINRTNLRTNFKILMNCFDFCELIDDKLDDVLETLYKMLWNNKVLRKIIIKKKNALPDTSRIKFKMDKWIFTTNCETAVKSGCLYNIKCLEDKITKPKYLFKVACERNNVNIAKWLYYNDKFPDINNDYELFLNACSDGNLEVAQWLYSLGISKKYMDDNKRIFSDCCMGKRLNIVRWLYELYNRNIQTTILKNAFVYSCSYNNIEIAHWLYNECIYNHTDVIEIITSGFQASCYNGNIELAKWLYNSDHKIDIYNDNEYAFRHSCKNDHVYVAKWLYSLNYKSKCLDSIYSECVKWHKNKVIAWLDTLNIDVL